MIKIGCNFLSLKDTTVEDFIEIAYGLKLDCVDFHYRAFESNDPEYLGKIKLMCLKYGLPIGYIGMSGLFVGKAEERAEHVQNCKDAIDLAAFVGSPIVRAFCAEIPAQNGDGDDPWPAMIAGYREIADYAATKGIAVGLQNHPSTGEDMLRIWRETDRANFTFVMDTGQWVGSPGSFRGDDTPEVDFYQFIEQVVPHAMYIRTKFYKIESGKEEWLDYERIAGMIKAANYNGCISIVYEGQREDRVEQVRLAAVYLRELLG
ncbi:MAG: TIM barrel protein [Candidatus Latescibacterota bacterium]|nr:TIM barrel protein [Candidatus Latescibacterota bacterium]